MSLPTFIVIGASRCGTTTLHHLLGRHPDIFMAPVKSPNYFVAGDPLPAWEGPRLRAMAKQWVTDRQAYEALFAGASGESAIGEVSPVYLQSRAAPRRIADACPDARLVAILRDPVDRAYAHYLGRRRDGLERRADFGIVVDQELSAPLPDEVAFGNYLGASRYGHFLGEYFARFPKDRIRVHLFEDFTANPRAVLADILAFVGVNPDVPIETKERHNASGEIDGAARRWLWTRTVALRTALRPYLPARIRAAGQMVIGGSLSRPPLPPDLRARVAHALRSEVDHLESLIGRDLSWWCRP